MPHADQEFFSYRGPWWVSGETGSGQRQIICAAVMALREDDAIAQIQAGYPAAYLRFRFVDEKSDLWSPFNSRFPRAEQMQWPWPLP